jgi:hypothetical protein
MSLTSRVGTIPLFYRPNLLKEIADVDINHHVSKLVSRKTTPMNIREGSQQVATCARVIRTLRVHRRTQGCW